ncbi:restriction endonuclease subunit S, partial [uncultured Thiodictyon sp.]|uniref:restriction endonuclease subunit S n=1 Tax=uncultured Thiodictyon sp. TaxID=1846217 RepID=UPI0025D63C41
DAVPRLRRFILDLAVRGKLVAQDPSDEPPLEQLKQARHRLEKAAETTKRLRWNPSLAITVADGGKDVPRGWLPARVNDTGLYINGLAFKPSDWKPEGLPIIRIQNLTDPSREFNFTQGDFPDEVLVRDGDILVSWSATLEAFNWDRGPGVLNQHIFRVIPDEGLSTRDFLLLLLRHAIREMADSEHAHGLVMSHINRGPFLEHIVLIAPLAEQHRIVAKVDELMALCDRLEAAQNKREQRRDRLVTASLQQLQDQECLTPRRQGAKEEKEAVKNDLGALAPWREPVFLQDIPRLTTRPEHIKALRQTILNLAVRGRLVTQDPTDARVQDFGITREVRQNDRLVLTLPDNWCWAKVEHVADARLGKMLDKAKNRGQRYRYLGNTNVHWFDIRTDDLKELLIEDGEIEKYLLIDGDVLICEGGHGIARTAVWRATKGDVAFQKALHRVRPSTALSSDFFAYCISAYFDAGVLQTYFTGVGIPHFTGRALSSLVFPLPPISEQRRIVAKVDELMAVCDQLEANLTTTQTDSRRLLEAVLRDALA